MKTLGQFIEQRCERHSSAWFHRDEFQTLMLEYFREELYPEMRNKVDYDRISIRDVKDILTKSVIKNQLQ